MTKSDVSRALLNDPKAKSKLEAAVQNAFDPVVATLKKHNTTYHMVNFHGIMVAASILNKSASGYAASMRKYMTEQNDLPPNHRMIPSDEWVRDLIARADMTTLTNAFTNHMAEQIQQLTQRGLLHDKMDVAIDWHDIPRWDAESDGSLVSTNRKKGTTRFERYMTVQSVNSKITIILAAIPMPASSNTATITAMLITLCTDAGVKINIVLLDRGYFMVDVINALNDADVGYLMPCKNTPGVAAAIREYAAGKRDAISTYTLTKSKHETVDFTMIITRRKRKRKASGSKPEETYIAFATNRPQIRVEQYKKRWAIETGYRMIEKQRVRTRSRLPAARLMCFLYSIMVYNMWVIINALATCVRDRITQTDLTARVVDWIRLVTMKGKPPPDGDQLNCHGMT